MRDSAVRLPALTLLMIVALPLLSSTAARADGGLFKSQGRDSTSYQPLLKREQRAAIHHRDGVQRMVITQLSAG
jgi:hypothetical protein